MPSEKLTPTPEQQAIIDAVLHRTESIMVTAYAGAAKTTTLEFVSNAQHWPSALALAFNVKIKTELEKRLSGFTVLTLNGLGHRAWANAITARLVVDDRKLGNIIKELGKGKRFSWDDTRRLVSGAMHAGLVPGNFRREGLVPDTAGSWQSIASELWIDDPPVEFAREVLVESIRRGMSGLISYDDQIYLSTMFGGVFPLFKLVLVDEAQDLSALNHIQIKRCATGRLIVVGDPKQSIYRFRGAASDSMEKLRALRPAWIDLPLHTTFRCPRVIVARQQAHAPGFTAAPSAPEGRVLNGYSKPDGTAPFGNADGSWSWSDVPSGKVAILCRNNSPLIAMGMKLLAKRIGFQMLGRDFSKGLLALTKRLFPDDNAPADFCLGRVQDWLAMECKKCRQADHLAKIASITDRAESLISILTLCPVRDAGDLRAVITEMFARENMQVTLASIHKAKGLEWPTVIHLDPWRVPSRHAKKQAKAGDFRQMIQENNLVYVAETRTKETLILANLSDFT